MTLKERELKVLDALRSDIKDTLEHFSNYATKEKIVKALKKQEYYYLVVKYLDDIFATYPNADNADNDENAKYFI
jgi:hypothetical protein